MDEPDLTRRAGETQDEYDARIRDYRQRQSTGTQKGLETGEADDQSKTSGTTPTGSQPSQ